jgi:hypothetical protein
MLAKSASVVAESVRGLVPVSRDRSYWERYPVSGGMPAERLSRPPHRRLSSVIGYHVGRGETNLQVSAA